MREGEGRRERRLNLSKTTDKSKRGIRARLPERQRVRDRRRRCVGYDSRKNFLESPSILELRILGRAREGYNITDIRHPRNKLHHALEA